MWGWKKWTTGERTSRKPPIAKHKPNGRRTPRLLRLKTKTAFYTCPRPRRRRKLDSSTTEPVDLCAYWSAHTASTMCRSSRQSVYWACTVISFGVRVPYRPSPAKLLGHRAFP
ncbi:hypothetical protein K443DRAFT_330345 [Laccaria amethystina LaAM-08-1]|uniref:Uncharacterized protein n=1 Tax=Laccaria amethystina LaAM-08-1 TaxID=1095629 RepID=A0A0C9XC19_9AGAR|nr:hypothetical protein K443DRAFT_330345 [Laccaria amethystina LaAM-08-1]